jgi:hypothetical protein
MNHEPYRVIHRRRRYAIHQVYYDEQGEIWTCSQEPAYPEGHSLDDLRADLARYWSALELPALEYADLVPRDEEPGVELPF